nr:putative reverse transcriptase domain-containing protein [Tanacetum cinerariifolium]
MVNVVADALSRKEQIKPLRDQALVMTVGLNFPVEILKAQSEARKEEYYGSKDFQGIIKKLDKCLTRAKVKAEYQKPFGLLVQHVILAKDGDAQLTGHEIVHETTEKIIQIKKHIQATRDRQKNLADRNHKPMEIQVGDMVMLKVSPWKGVIRFRKREKLNPRYIRPFKVLTKVRMVAYRLELPDQLSRVHSTFHVSNLKKCYADEPLAISLNEIQINDKLNFIKEPVEIMDHEVKHLKQSHILIVKVGWNSRRGPKFTWEREDQMKKKLPPCSAITPNEPIDSLSIGDEHLDTVSATESDEFIKSSAENLVPNPSESEGEYECYLPAGFTTFSNVLFDADYVFDSSDDQSFSEEDFPKKIYSNPLFDDEIIPMKIDHHPFNAESDLIESMPNHDSSIIISSKIDSLFNEFASELTLLKSIPLGIDETNCYPEKEIHFTKRLLYDNSSPRPPEEFVYENSNVDIESFSASPIPIKDSDSRMKEIDLSFNPDDPMPPVIEEDDDEFERDIPILKELLVDYSLSLPVNESYHFDILSSSCPPAKHPDGNTGTLNIKMMGDISD